MAKEPKKGIVYIVQNPAFPHLFKIGRTGMDSIEDRGLNASNVPEDFVPLFGYECNNPKEVEDHLHEICKESRHYTTTGRKTEFFYVGCLLKAKKALELFEKGAKEISGDDISLKEDDKAEYDETKNIEIYAKAEPSIKSIYDEVSSYITSLDKNIKVNEKPKRYVGFLKDEKIFIAREKGKRILTLLLKLNPKPDDLEEGFTKNISGMGNAASLKECLKVFIKNETDFEKAKPLIERAYKEN